MTKYYALYYPYIIAMCKYMNIYFCGAGIFFKLVSAPLASSTFHASQQFWYENVFTTRNSIPFLSVISRLLAGVWSMRLLTQNESSSTWSRMLENSKETESNKDKVITLLYTVKLPSLNYSNKTNNYQKGNSTCIVTDCIHN